ncbi:MAG: hypothetical protein HFG51_16495 [Lachnospiraceae bacterium]|nr:hypothetical protein [Lachnospiraceae bacterium]
MVVYGSATGASISKLFLAGFLPGILIGLGLISLLLLFVGYFY